MLLNHQKRQRRNKRCHVSITKLPLLAALLIATGVMPGTGGQAILAQPTVAPKPAASQFTLTKPGAQTLSLGKRPYGAQQAGRITCNLLLEKGEISSATLIVRMLASDGADVTGWVRLLGGYDQTLQVPLGNLKAGAPIQIIKDIVTASRTAAVSVELKGNVTKSPCVVRLSALTLEERQGDPIVSTDHAPLVTSPEKGFAYARNLLPATDSPKWTATGPAARRGTGPAGQSILALDEYTDGRWESPIAPLGRDTKELCFQAFVKFDQMATPFAHPFKIIYRDRAGKALSIPGAKAGWPSWEWNHIYGQWIPFSIRSAVPDKAASAQLVMELNKGESSPWQNQGEKARNNFVTFQMAGLRLWEEAKPSPADISPFNFTNWAGGAADAGPFVPCKANQENSLALWSYINDTSNLYFSKDGRWPSPRARVENFLPISRTVDLNGKIFDWTGDQIGSVSCSVRVGPYQVTDVELPIAPIRKSGCYSLNLDAMQDGSIVGQGVIRWGCFYQPNERADRNSMLYPFCFHPTFSAQGASSAKCVELEAKTLRAMGVRGFRLQCRLWGLDGTDLEKAVASVREYSDNFHQQVWPAMQRYGFDGFISFFPKPRAPIPAAGSPEMDAWKKYVAAAVKAYPEISTFAFGNEEVGHLHKKIDDKPQIWGYLGSMRDYTRQFLAAHQAALAARPEITFVVGQASDPESNVAKLFFEAGGTAKDVQGWAINSYGNSPATWRNLSDVLEKNGVDLSKAVGLIPEIGYGVRRRGPKRIAEERGEAVDLVRSYVQTLAAAPWIRDYCWFTTVSRGAVVHNFVFDTDWSPKPMVGAYMTLSSTLGAGRPTRVAELADVSAYLWQRPDGSKAGVIWAPDKTQLRVRVGKTDGPVIIRDMMGNDTTVTPKAGVAWIDVSQTPIYLLNIQTLQAVKGR